MTPRYLSTFGRSPSFNHVTGIVRWRAGLKMIWTYAGRVVAFMSNNQSLGHASISQLVCNTVGMRVLPVSTECSIPIREVASGPCPTVITLSNFRPETPADRLVHVGLATGTRAEPNKRKNDGVALPTPTRATVGDVLRSHKTVIASLRAVFRRPLAKMGRPYLKRLIAPLTNARYFMNSYDLNLRDRLGLWSGSLAAQTVCEPLCILTRLRAVGGGMCS